MGGPFLEIVVGDEPVHHVGGRHLQAAVECTCELGLAADADDVGIGFDARSGELSFLVESHGELDIHRGFDAGTERFAVGLEGVPVSDVEECAGLVDRQVDCGAFSNLVVVDVAAVGA